MVATISQVASKVGIRPDTIRYYERVGLLPLPDRRPNGYRSYGEDDVERLRFIRGAQRLGLKLRDGDSGRLSSLKVKALSIIPTEV